MWRSCLGLGLAASQRGVALAGRSACAVEAAQGRCHGGPRQGWRVLLPQLGGQAVVSGLANGGHSCRGCSRAAAVR